MNPTPIDPHARRCKTCSLPLHTSCHAATLVCYRCRHSLRMRIAGARKRERARA